MLISLDNAGSPPIGGVVPLLSVTHGIRPSSYRRQFPGLGQRRAGETRKLEVGDLEHEIVTVDEHVGRLEAAVDDSRAVRKPQPGEQLIGKEATV